MGKGANAAGDLAVNERDHVQGPEWAPVTLLEYGDYECDDTLAARPVIATIQREFGDNLRFVYRDFPLEEHPHAWHAALAAESAAAQGKFWQMHDALFRYQNALADADILHYARDLGLDADRMAQEITGGVYAGCVVANLESGRHNGVTETPSFFVNGVFHGGPGQLGSLAEAIRRAVAR